MSLKKYTLKKDLKPIVLISFEKFPPLCQTPVLKRLSPKPRFRSKDNTSRSVAKSLQTLKNLQKAKSRNLTSKSPPIYFNSSINQSKTPLVNIRYIKDNFEEADDLNAIQTPSESIKNNSKGLEEGIKAEYEKYMEEFLRWRKNDEGTCEEKGKKKFKKKRMNKLCKSPDVNFFLRVKRAF